MGIDWASQEHVVSLYDELREWSRIDEELKVERGRLISRFRHQLWRYYPQMLGLTDDVGATWFLDLHEAVPTPEKAANVRKKTIARIPKNHRIRRFDAAHVLTERVSVLWQLCQAR